MKNKAWSLYWPLAAVCLLSLAGWSQQIASGGASSAVSEIGSVPNLVRYSGALTDGSGKPLSGIIGVTFSLYKDSQGGAPLWMETQNVQLDKSGHYSVMLGSTTTQGLPLALFSSAEARWLGVQVQGYAEQPRVLLLSVPYALKAGDAATIGGLPPSSFVLASPGNGSSGSSGSGANLPGNAGPNISGSGTQNFIPLWTDNNGTLGNSVIFQSGSGSTAKTGVNTTTPAATLDVNGNTIARGPVQLPSTGTANASQGFISQPFSLQGSAFNSGTQQAIGPIFQWQTEPVGNNTSSPSGSLNLLYGSGSGSPGETGVNIASNGIVTFVKTQTFPNTLNGITAGTGISVTGSKTNPTVGINVSFANQNFANLNNANTFSKSQTVNGTMTATNFSGNGAGLTNVNATQLGGLSSSAFAQLAQPNTFNANQTVNGSVNATSFSGGGSGLSNVNAAELGGLPPASYQPAGSYATTGANTFTGDQSVTGNVSATGSVTSNTATFTGLLTTNGALLPASGTAGASQGYNSQPLDAVTSVYNSAAGQAQNQDFRWQAEPVGNDSNTPSGKLNLLFGANGGTPTETGLSVASNGLVTFATGQSFPGTGNGTITGVTAGTDLIGGGAIGNVTLSVDTTQVVTGVTAGTDLTGGGVGGVQTLNLDTTKVPQFSANNSFTGAVGIGAPSNPNGWTPLALGSGNSFGTWMTLANTSTGGHTWNILSAGAGNSEGAGNLGITDFTGSSKIFLEGNVNATSLTATGTVSGGVVNAGAFNLAGVPFVTGSYGIGNAFFGFNVGNSTMTGGNNLAVGGGTFWQNTTGNQNTALGEFSLYANTTGAQNTATGYNALSANSSGGYNTADGIDALVSNNAGGYNSATGALALEANTTGAGNTAGGYTALQFNTAGNSNTALGANALYTNSTGSYNTALGTYAGVPPDQAQTTGSNNTFVGSFANVSGTNETTLSNATAIGAYAQVTKNNALVLGSIKGVNGASANAFVGIGTTAPQESLEVDSGDAMVRGSNNFQKNGDTANLYLGDLNNSITATFGKGISFSVFDYVNALNINQYSGFVGIGTPSPDMSLTVANGNADKPGGGSWATFSDARLKNLHGSFTAGLNQIMRLHPIRYRYKDDNALGIRDRDEHVGFVAQEVQRVIPEAVTENSKGYLLVNNDPILWTMLNAIQEQQREIRRLRAQLHSQSRPTRQAVTKKADAQEVRILHAELSRLREKDSRLEDRLTRLERSLKDLGSQTTTVALAEARK